jgi:MFS transporter, PPP family, 3-phenylpropionic acid transporter
MTERGSFVRFIALYAALFSAFGFASPFLPAFLAERGLAPEQLGLVLGAATALRLVCGPLAGRLADRFHFLRAELAVCAVLAAGAALLYLAAHGFWMVMAISLLQAAALAPLVPLADALSLAHARPLPNKQAFEYGWVRGAGSAAFVAGTLAAGQAASRYGLAATIWLSAAALLIVPIAARLVPAFPVQAASHPAEVPLRPWLTLLRQRAFVWVILIAALVLGSHAMNDSFAVIHWTQAGIGAAAIGVLWSESVAAEVLVFFFLGPRLLRAVSPVGALAVAAFCGVVRWGVLALTADVVTLGLVPRLHIRASPSRSDAHHRRYGPPRLGGHRTGRLQPRRGRGRHRRFASALRLALRAFRSGRFLGHGSALRGGLPLRLAAAAGPRAACAAKRGVAKASMIVLAEGGSMARG